ncbi:MAG: iron-containing alcohol dehydrogenase [Lachnospiraceae bacterium]|nr:iron-containing alcohol dehydrogenase [Lachnospiraceae bacterium]
MKSFEMKTKIFFGDNALNRLMEIPYERILIITDHFMAGSPMIDLILSPLKQGGKQIEIFKDVVPDPPIDKISEGVEVMLKYKPDAVVAVGGGSAIDAAKAIREFSLRIDAYQEVGLIAIPTTSGTGSEVTSFSVITDPEAQRKYPLAAEAMTPMEAILDAELVKSVPPSVTADTGMDVFTHALEACVSTNRHDFSTSLAEKAIEIFGVFMLRAYLDGNDTHAREKMHTASCLAGLAFNSTSLGLNHAMAHQLGAKLHIAHGRANALLLPHVIEYNSDINKHSKSRSDYLPAVKHYTTVSKILGLSSYNTVMTVRSLVNWVQFMMKEMDIPLSISQIGTITAEAYFGAIEEMTDAALVDECIKTNPRVPCRADIIRIYKDLW